MEGIYAYGLQFTLEQHRFKLLKSIYTWIFFSKNIGKFLEICDNLKKLGDNPID